MQTTSGFCCAGSKTLTRREHVREWVPLRSAPGTPGELHGCALRSRSSEVWWPACPRANHVVAITCPQNVTQARADNLLRRMRAHEMSECATCTFACCCSRDALRKILLRSSSCQWSNDHLGDEYSRKFTSMSCLHKKQGCINWIVCGHRLPK